MQVLKSILTVYIQVFYSYHIVDTCPCGLAKLAIRAEEKKLDNKLGFRDGRLGNLSPRKSALDINASVRHYYDDKKVHDHCAVKSQRASSANSSCHVFCGEIVGPDGREAKQVDIQDCSWVWGLYSTSMDFVNTSYILLMLPKNLQLAFD